MEVLAARDRLDDRWWPFPARLRPALTGLERLGLIQTMHGIIQGTIRADITDAGRELYQTEPHGPSHRSASC